MSSLGKGETTTVKCTVAKTTKPVKPTIPASNANMPSKTPVSLLQELCVRRGITPKYDLLQVEGAVHEPTYLFRVSLGDGNQQMVATGKGQSKKTAKHIAAKALLDKLVGNSPVGQNGDAGDIPEPNLPQSYNDGIVGNPVGQLQEVCMNRRCPPPTYSVASEDGLPHERVYSIQCTVGKIVETGTGKSKKLAKRQASSKMMQTLKETPMDSSLVADETEFGEKLSSRYTGLKGSKIPTLNSSHSEKVSQFHKNLKSSDGKRLAELQKKKLNVKTMDYVAFLQEIAVEQNFEVTYVDIEETSYSGRHQCLVQLSTLPVAVCYGVGENSQQAQKASALNALEYLKIMTKK